MRCSRFTKRLLAVGLLVVLFPSLQAAETVNRTVLPILEPDSPLDTVLDVRDAEPPPRFEVEVR